MFPCMHKCNAGCESIQGMPGAGAGSDRLHVHRNFVRGNEKYNIFDFGENRTERQIPPHTIFEDPWMPGAGSDRLHAHRNIVRCAEKYNIFDFEENRTSHCFGTVSFEKCRCYFGTEGVHNLSEYPIQLPPTLYIQYLRIKKGNRNIIKIKKIICHSTKLDKKKKK